MKRLLSILLLSAVLAACTRDASPPDEDSSVPAAPPPTQIVRIATYNTSLFDPDGRLVARLEAGDDTARRVAAVIQHVRPDVLLLNEFDHDAGERAAELFQRNYLEVGQDGQAPIRYDWRYTAPVNTGEPSGLDLDGDGSTDSPNDAWGFGRHPGQYGMLVLSRYRIDAAAVRSFRQLRWAALPDARRPRAENGAPFHPDAIWQQLRLSSKSFWDVPIHAPGGMLHFLVAHPTPPVFDGPEDRNGLRNFDEIRLVAEYLTPGVKPWLCDDAGRCGGLAADARFVIAGDMNADPADGDGVPGAIAQLLEHPRVNAAFVPRSAGASAQAQQYGVPRRGDASTHTGDYGPKTGTLRLDYVLPSRDLPIRDGGVFWPAENGSDTTVTMAREWISASDHRAVWLDLDAGTP